MINQKNLRATLQVGLIAGVVALTMCMIGIVQSFDVRDVISETLSLGQILLFAAAPVAGYLASRRDKKAGLPARLLTGLLGGLLAAVPIYLLILLTLVWTTIRTAFVNVKPELIQIITLGHDSAAAGGLQLMLIFTGLGLVGGLFGLIPDQFRRAILNGLGWSIGLGTMTETMIGILRARVSSATLNTLFGKTGINLVPFIILFLLIVGLTYWWRGAGQGQITTVRERLSPTQQTWSRRTATTALILFILVLPSILGVYLSEIINNVGLYILMGLGLNIAVGLAGLLDLGYVTNFAVGAYIMALLTSTSQYGLESPISFWIALPICVLAAMMTGFFFALPVLKMRGDYLAIATLGFGEIVRVLARSDALKPLIGGAQGILQIPQARIAGFFATVSDVVLTPINGLLGRFDLSLLQVRGDAITFGTPPQLYYLIILACLLMLFISYRLNNSRTGRRWLAIREDEDVAAAMGINTTNAKVIAFTLSAASGGLAGAIFAAKLGSIYPHSFQLLISINVLSLIIVGGMGSIPGVVVGALALVGVPELLREFAEFRLLFYGIALIVMMLVRPEGLWPSEVQRRELRGEEDDMMIMQPAPGTAD